MHEALLHSRRFELKRQLGAGGMGVVYEALDRRTGEVVALKTLRRLNPEQIYRFKQEFRALADLHHANLVGLGELHCEEGVWFFTMELVRGHEFGAYVRADPARLRRALAQLAEALDALHRHGRVHRDLKPSNVLVDDAGRVVVLDFGLSAPVVAGTDPPTEPRLLGTAPFLAPELERDPRGSPASDWYAVGVMLFEALTGELPFAGPPLAVLRAKLECRPPRAAERAAGVPRDLDDLCAALLDVDPAARPNGAEVIDRLLGTASSAPAAGASATAATVRPIFVGREAELRRLNDAFAVTGGGALQVAVIEGDPGIGKTELVQEFLRTLELAERPVVLRGRCYEQEHVPFKAFDGVMDSLSHRLKAMDDVAAASLLPPRPQLVVDLFPVIRRVPAVARVVPMAPRIGPAAQARSSALDELRLLFAAIAESSRLVLFLDDVQWADEASLSLLERLLGGAAPPAMLLIIARRCPPPGGADPLASLLARAALGERLIRLELAPLAAGDAEALCRALAPTAAAPAIAQDSGGHPLLLRELIRATATEVPAGASGVIELDEMLRRRLAAQPSLDRRVLELVALAGIPLPLDILAAAAALGDLECDRAVQRLVAQQLLRRDGTDARRTVEPYHDRVRETVAASLSALGPTEIEDRHFALGRALLDLDFGGPLAAARHLNRAGMSRRDPDQRRRVVERNLHAIRQAKLATAYDTARELLAAAHGQRATLEESVARRFELPLDLEELELDYLTGDRDTGVARFEEVLTRRYVDEDLARLFEAKIIFDTSFGRYREALDTGRRGLDQLGARLSGGVVGLAVELLRVKWRFRGARRDQCATLPEAEDPRVRARMRILMAMVPAAFFSDPDLMGLLVLRMVDTTLREGLTAVSSFGFGGYALVLAGGFQRYAEAYQLTVLARALNERFQNAALDGKLLFIQGAMAAPYVRPLAEARALLEEAERAALRSGDMQFRTFSATIGAILFEHAGHPLADVEARWDASRRVAEQEGNRDMIVVAMWGTYRAARLRGSAAALGAGAPADLVARTSDEHTPGASFNHHDTDSILLYHAGRYPEAWAAAIAADARAKSQLNVTTLLEAAFYRCLLAGRLGRRRALAIYLDKLRTWAEACPTNWSSRWRIAVAELARARGRHDDAKASYHAAIDEARREGALHVAAIGLERLAELASADGPSAEARRCWDVARDAYDRWGAAAVVERLGQEIR